MSQENGESGELRLSVRVSRIRPWERVFVVGSMPTLGSWQPANALHMERSGTDRDVWVACVTCPVSLETLAYRYFIGYILDPATDGIGQEKAAPQLAVHRWECSAQPRALHPNLLQLKNGRFLRDAEDTFGHIDGRARIHDGWLMHANEHAFYVRIHGRALRFYSKRDQERTYRLKAVPFDVRFKERSDDDGSCETSDLPDFPSFSNTELSVLTREDPIYGEQYENGSVFRNDVDYLVFRTRTVSIEHLGFRVELFSSGENGEKSVRLGVAYALPAALPASDTKTTLPIIACETQRPIGTVNLDYMLASSMRTSVRELRDSMKTSFARHWKKRRTLEVGHRGSGCSYTKDAAARENTLQSLQDAGKRGADFVEFDVQLTKDRQAIIYHDFHVLVEVTGRTVGSNSGSLSLAEGERNQRLHEMAVKDLKLSQLHLLHVEHVSVSEMPGNALTCSIAPVKKVTLSVTPRPSDGEDVSANPFPLLAEALDEIDLDVGFNIEIKYPMRMKGGDHECNHYFERNEFVDVILNVVMEKSRTRRILFSSFEPDICTLLTAKQHRFPVLFLVVGATARYEPFEDVRSDCSRLAVNFAAGHRLLGVNFHSEELLKNTEPFVRACNFGLVSFVWGDDLNDRSVQEYFKQKLNVDGLIYDRIGEEESRNNVFSVERQVRSALFARSTGPSPSVSRRSSLESVQDNLGAEVRTRLEGIAVRERSPGSPRSPRLMPSAERAGAPPRPPPPIPLLRSLTLADGNSAAVEPAPSS